MIFITDMSPYTTLIASKLYYMLLLTFFYADFFCLSNKESENDYRARCMHQAILKKITEMSGCITEMNKSAIKLSQ